MDHCGNVYRHGGTCADRGAGRFHQGGRAQCAVEPCSGGRRLDAVCHSCLCGGVQHTGGCCNDPRIRAVGANHGRTRVETADPLELCRDSRRYADPDRNLDQPVGRRCGAGKRPAGFHDLRSDAAGLRSCDLGHDLPSVCRAVPIAGAVFDGHAFGRQVADEVFYRGRDPRRQFADRAVRERD